MQYVNVKSNIGHKHSLVPVQEIFSKVEKDSPLYKSIFYYSDKHLTLPSLAGVKDVVTDKLYFDFDHETSPELAKNDALELCFRLVEKGADQDSISVFFSGKKGFHVEVTLDALISPEQFKASVMNLASDLSTLDKVVNDPQRLLRVENTKHESTGLYKIPLSLEELESKNLDYFKELAKNPRELSKQIKKTSFELFKVEKPEKKPLKIVVDNSEQFKTDMASKPRHWKPYKWALAKGWFEPGERHNALLVIAATCRGLGYDKTQAYYLCKDALKKMALRTNTEDFPKEELWDNIIEKTVYSDKWQGGQFSPETNEWLRSYCERMGIEVEKETELPTMQIGDAFTVFQDYAENIDANTIKTGIEELDEKLRLTIGMSIGIVAPPSAGKTTLMFEILKNVSASGIRGIFFSYDMYHSLVVMRLLQKEFAYSEEKILNIMKNGSEAEKDRLKKKIADKYSNIEFCFKVGQTVDDICATIQHVEDKTGEKVRMIAVDYSELVISEISDPTQASAFVAQKMREIATLYNVCVINLLQPTKNAGDPSEEILSYTSAKGSGAIAQSVTAMLSLSRPGFNPKDSSKDKFMTINCVKNRMGPLFSLDLRWDGLTGATRSLTEEEWEELEAIKEEKRKIKNDF